MEQLKETKSSKKRLGKTLKDFEDEFFLANERKVQKEDRLPREAEYREYKVNEIFKNFQVQCFVRKSVRSLLELWPIFVLDDKISACKHSTF